MSTLAPDFEKGLDRACQWLHEWNEAIRAGEELSACTFASPETFKHYFLDEEFHNKMKEHYGD